MVDKTIMIKRSTGFIEFIKREVVFSISLLLAVITSLFSVPKLEYINFKTIFCLLNLMAIVKAFEELKILDMIAVKILSRFKDSRMVSLTLILLAFLSSMLLTNDVALLTFVPLTLIIGRLTGFNCTKTIIFQTLAANIGSSLTPMGNPQNLFLFTHYNLNIKQILSTVGPFTAIGLIWLILLNLNIPVSNLIFTLSDVKIKDFKKTAIYSLLFLIVVLSVFDIIDYRIAAVLTFGFISFNDKMLLYKIDYFLIMTFIFFFIFIGNISSIEAIYTHLRAFLSSNISTYFSSLLLSQIISNVPAAILISGFTQNWEAVLLGVNIGGMGTLIASLASIISYRLYINEYDDAGRYLLKFSLYNFVSLAIFTILNFIFFYI